MYIIRTASQAQKEERKKRFPFSEPKDWELVETFAGKELRVGYYDTKEEAEAAEAEYKFYDVLKGDLEVWVDEMADKYGKEPSEIEKVIKEVL